MSSTRSAAPRCAALVGPYLSGKTTLLESLLSAAGAVARKGSVQDGSAVGLTSPEAKARKMSTEIAVACCEYLGDRWTFLDCPGSVELGAEALSAAMVADVAVVVCEPDADKAMALGPLLKRLDDAGIPHMLFVNKVDTLGQDGLRIRDLVQALQAVSARPLVLREVPIREGGGVTGYVDLVSERCYQYKPHAASDQVPMPDTVREREASARQEMLEALADFDDELLAKLLDEVPPEKAEVYGQLRKDLQRDLIVPVFFGSAENDNGIRRLLKALRHETPEPAAAAERLGIAEGAGVAAQVFRTLHAPHSGKLSFARVFRGTVADGMTLAGERVSGLYRPQGGEQAKLAQAGPGEVVALGRMAGVGTGDLLTDTGPSARCPAWPEPDAPVYGLALQAVNRNDEVKLSAALQKLLEEDPGLRFEQNADLGELVLWGQGDIHLQLALDRLRGKYNLPVRSRAPQVAYKETIRKGCAQHSRFKRQTGGHGQFADVHVEVSPLPRGGGFAFSDRIVGGAIPRQFIPAVEAGLREALASGPLGFPVVDVAVALTGGQFHAVDSSEQAFRTAGRQAMAEALPKCEPVLLEPVMSVAIDCPAECTAKVQRLVTGRRGQLLGYDLRPGWTGWDEVRATMPQAEMHDMILELRSITQGVGTFTFAFDHLAELIGRLADKAVSQRHAHMAAQ
ncbi:elongation factor G [Arenibaculum pallidiluteum]|uniref:elongation factor G n=1 Tax=Arenibaculum pallidiluteum TaxID=2812559 RepID=UPI001A96B502|nr:elongation factor G [Arenibaculum pallidiluteum]